MKQILFFTLMLLAIPLFGQTRKDIQNCTTATLDSAEVFTGYRTDVTDYNSVSISMISDNAVTLQLQFGELVNTVFTPQRYFNFSYTADDSTFTKTVPIVAPYYRIVATNAPDSMTSFSLTAMLYKGFSPPITETALIEVNLGGVESGVTIPISEAGSSNKFTTGFGSTVGTTADTLTFGFTSREFTIRNEGVLTDTLYVSADASFPVGSTWVYRGGEYETVPVAATVLYVKGGALYVASRKYIITAN